MSDWGLARALTVTQDDLDQVVTLEMKKRGWIHKYFVKSICEGAAID